MRPTGTDANDAVLDHVVDLDRYPLLDPDSDHYRAAVGAARSALADDGCARLDGFIRPDRHVQLAAESRELEPLVQVKHTESTPYVTVDASFPDGHPRNRRQEMTNGFVTRDLIPPDSLTQRLYASPAFIGFVADCFAKTELHRFADPMRGLVVNVMDDGAELPWHFDANEMVVSLMTVRSAAGGEFEYCPNIRAPEHENYDDVQAVLDGDRGPVKQLDLRVGDLQLFMGRYSMHRVRPGRGVRHTTIFGYSEYPGYVSSADSTRQAYGRCMQEHIDADRDRHLDGLAG